jgi:hypothetical protein
MRSANAMRMVVIPAQAGSSKYLNCLGILDPRLRGDDDRGRFEALLPTELRSDGLASM